MKKIRMIFLTIGMVLASAASVLAATYYISPGGSDTLGSGTSLSPWATLNKGCDSMAANDTLILKDGTYSGALNMIDYHIGQYPPSGTGGSYTTVRAENDGMAVIDGEMARTPFDGHDSDYLIIQGIIFKNSDETVFSLSGNSSNLCSHIKILKCGFSDSNNANGVDCDLFYFRWCEYSLVEDCYAWGNGKYRYIFLDCNHCIMRRCIDRFDRGYGGQYSNMGSFRLYGADYCLVQNCIAIDGDQQAYIRTTGTSAGSPKFIWFGPNGSTGTICTNNQVIGCISLNNTAGFLAGYMGTDSLSNNVIKDCVFWNTPSIFWNRCSGSANTLTINHCTFGVMRGASLGGALYSDAANLISVTNSIFYDISTANANSTTNYNAYYGNSVNVSGVSLGANDVTNINPRSGSLLYLTQIEDSTALSGTAGDGGDRGATILKQVGVTGTVYGETGYNTVTGNDLWPFPNEDVIRAKLRAYSYDSGNLTGARGFCADGQTLTKYIWEYLGNTIPSSIYAGVPLAVSTSSLSAGSVSAAYSQTVQAEGGTTPYSWALSSGSLPGGLSLNASTGAISGTPTAAGTYNFVIRVSDSASASATQSLSIIINAADSVAPSAVSNLSSTGATSGSVALSWSSPGDDGSTGTATSYDVRYSTATITASNWASATQASGEPAPLAAGTTQTMTISGLSAATTYYFAMKATDDASNISSLSNVASGATTMVTDTTAPAIVSNLSMTGTTGNSVTLSWTAPGDDANSGTAAGYDVRYSTTTLATWDTATQASGEPAPSAAGTTQTMTITGLSASTTYYFGLKTTDDASNISDVSNVVTATTTAAADTTAPSAVSNLSSTGATSGSVALSWSSPGDDGSTGTATSYDVRYSTATITASNWASATQASGEPAPLIAGTTQTMTISGLSAATTYYFAMKATDDASNISSLSNVANRATAAAADTTAPYTTGYDPASGEVNVQPNTPIVLHVKDDGAGVDINTIVMRVNGAVVTPVITGTPADYTLTYTPPQSFEFGQTVSVSVEAKDLAP